MSASDNPKARADAKLKTLPAERQAAVFDYLQGHKLSEARAWLKEDGLATSLRALSEFRLWYELRQQFAEDETTTETLLEQLKREAPGMSEEQLDEIGQRTFSLLAIRRQDTDAFVKVRSARSKAVLEAQKLRLRERAERRLSEALNLQRQRFQRETAELYLTWSADVKARKIAASGSSNTEKIEQLGQLMFGATWKT